MWSMNVVSVLLAALTPWQSPPTSPATSSGTRDLSSFVTDLMDRYEIPGIAIALVQSPEFTQDGKWFKETTGFGIRNAAGDPMEANSLLSIASNSKLFASISAGLLVSNQSLEPRLTWDTKVANVIPEWKLMDEVASRETDLVDLMSHRTGLPRHEASYDAQTSASGMIRQMRHLRPSAGFRQAWQYQNLHYVAASHLAPSLTGVRFIDYVQRNIWDPLGMNNSFYNVSTARATGRLADGFVKVDRNLTECVIRMKGGAGAMKNGKIDKSCLGKTKSVGWFIPGDGEAHAGPGGVITCAEDMATWLQTLLLNGRSSRTNDTIIPSDVIQRVARGYTVPTGTSIWPELSVITYGMGQQRGSYRGYEYLEHGGADTGQMSQVIRLPGKGIGIAIMINDDQFGTALTSVIKLRILDEMLGLEPIDWEERLMSRPLLALKAPTTPRPSHPTLPSNGFSSLIGTYHDAGYGNMTLCPLPSSFPATARPVLSSYCTEVLSTQPFPIHSFTAPTYIIPINKLWIAYYAFTHFDGQVFNVTSATLWPDTGLVTFSAHEEYNTVIAEFDDDGFGMGGGFWGTSMPNGDMGGKGVKDGAEVYFAKI